MRRIAFVTVPLITALTLGPYADPAVDRGSAGYEVDAADPAQVEMAAWAMGRFEAAGLDLPYVVITFPGRDLSLCDGDPAVAYLAVEPAEVRVCWSNPFILLHELAHIWETHHLDDPHRREFAALRGGVTAWLSREVPWEQRAGEHAANVIAWGLLEDPYPVSRTYPNDPESMMTAYRHLTGRDPLHEGHEPITPPDRDFHGGRENPSLEFGR